MDFQVTSNPIDMMKLDETAIKSLIEQNHLLKIQVTDLSNKVVDLEERLKKYTNGSNHKRYYEKNKEKIKESGSNYLLKLKNENPEKLKEYSRRAYANKKKKMLENTLANNSAEESERNNKDDRSLSPIPIIV